MVGAQFSLHNYPQQPRSHQGWKPGDCPSLVALPISLFLHSDEGDAPGMREPPLPRDSISTRTLQHIGKMYPYIHTTHPAFYLSVDLRLKEPTIHHPYQQWRLERGGGGGGHCKQNMCACGKIKTPSGAQ